MWTLLKSVMRSIVEATRNDPEVQRSLAAHPRLLGWVAGRFDTRDPFGLRLTLGAALSFAFLLFFFSVVEDLISRDPLVLADLRVLSVVQLYRSPNLNGLMKFLTYLGNWQVVGAGSGLFLAYLALTRQWRWALALFVSVPGGELLVWLGKTGFARPRPDLVNALIPAQGMSFPSGHAFVAVSFYGLVALHAIDRARTCKVKIVVALLAAATILSIGFSRIYLGVHWPSDVLASYALGGAWLSIIATSLSIAGAPADEARPFPKPFRKAALAGLLGLVWVGFVAAFDFAHPLPDHAQPEEKPVDLRESDFPANLFAQDPRFSEDILGRPMEPINVILVGSEPDVVKAFADIGWEATDLVSFASSWRMLVAELNNQASPNAPGLPTFWRGRPNRRGYQRVDPAGSARERHHLHLWETAYRVDGNPVWLGTVHFDKQVRTADGTGLLIHQIDPAVDREREALRTDLSRTNCDERMDEAVVTAPMLGQNAVGNPFFTDGNALIAFLKCTEETVGSTGAASGARAIPGSMHSG